MRWTGFFSEARSLGIKKTLRFALRYLTGKLFDFPEAITVEASSRCNLNCKFCITTELGPKKKRGRDFFPLADFKPLVDDICRLCPRMNFSLYGEPLLNPELSEMIAYSEKKGMATTLVTNATLLTPENRQKLLDSGLTRVITSLESFKREIYETTKCGGSLDKTRENIHAFIEEKRRRNLKSPQIVLRRVVTKKTVDDLDAFFKKARELGADAVSLKPLAVWAQGSIEYKTSILDEFAVDHRISRFEKNEQGQFILKKRSTPCFSLKTPGVLSDGRVVLCWYDPLGETVMGSIGEESFKTVWKKTRSFRKKRMISGEAFSICQECAGIGADTHQLILL